MKRAFFICMYIILLFTNIYAAGVNLSIKKGYSQSLNEEGFSQLYSVSANLLPAGIKHPGIGISCDFEKYLGHYLAIDCNAGISAFYANWFNFSDPVTDISVGINLRGYPFYQTLKGFYGGFGTGCDAIFYLGSNGVPADAQKLFFYIKPELGWKFYLLNHFMIDISVDYKKRFIITPNNLPKFYSDALSEGFHAGVGFKFFWGK